MPITSNYYSHDVCFSVSSFPKDLFWESTAVVKGFANFATAIAAQPCPNPAIYHVVSTCFHFVTTSECPKNLTNPLATACDSHQGNTPSTLIALEENFDQQESRPIVCWAFAGQWAYPLGICIRTRSVESCDFNILQQLYFNVLRTHADHYHPAVRRDRG